MKISKFELKKIIIITDKFDSNYKDKNGKLIFNFSISKYNNDISNIISINHK